MPRPHGDTCATDRGETRRGQNVLWPPFQALQSGTSPSESAQVGQHLVDLDCVDLADVDLVAGAGDWSTWRERRWRQRRSSRLDPRNI